MHAAWIDTHCHLDAPEFEARPRPVSGSVPWPQGCAALRDSGGATRPTSLPCASSAHHAGQTATAWASIPLYVARASDGRPGRPWKTSWHSYQRRPAPGRGGRDRPGLFCARAARRARHARAAGALLPRTARHGPRARFASGACMCGALPTGCSSSASVLPRTGTHGTALPMPSTGSEVAGTAFHAAWA